MEKQHSLNDTLISEKDVNKLEINAQDKHYLDNLPQIYGGSIWSKTFFSWLNPLFRYGSKHEDLTSQQIPKMPKEDQTHVEFKRMQENWDSTKKSKSEGYTLIRVVFKTFIRHFLRLLAVLLIVVALYCLFPYLTSSNIDYIQNHSSSLNYGIALFSVTVVVNLLHRTFFAHMIYQFDTLSTNITNTLKMMLYAKSLRFNSLANKQFTEAEVINYMQTDAGRLGGIGYHISTFFYGPIQIIAGLVLIYTYVGLSFVAAVAVMVLLAVFSWFNGKAQRAINEKKLKAKDERLKVTKEMLDIIRFIKISVIEKFFFKKIDEKRAIQLALNIKRGGLNMMQQLAYRVSVPLMLSATFAMYQLTGHQITSQVAFSVMMAAQIMEHPINGLPNSITELIQVMVSIKRIEKFLFAEQIQVKNNQSSDQLSSQVALSITNGNFFWGKEQKEKDEDKDKKRKLSDSTSSSSQQAQQNNSNLYKALNDEITDRKEDEKKQKQFEKIHVLKDINLEIKKGRLIMIIGDIGSGKSSILLALLNEMYCDKASKIKLGGSVAYTAQKPWIMSRTVKENITFTLPYDQEKFRAAVRHASLDQDLQNLPHHEDTQIGQKGVNLSGGQKARVALARAIYSNKDIYMLDDILSAVDVHVGEFLIRQTLRGYLHGKTIVMPTHAVKFLEEADEVIIMKKGRIVGRGHYHQIKNSAEFKRASHKQQEHVQQKKEVSKQEQELQAEQKLVIAAMLQKKQSEKQNKEKVSQEDQKMEQMVEQLILPEDKEKGQINLGIILKFIRQGGGIWLFVLMVGVMEIISQALRTFAAIFMKDWCINPDQTQLLYYYIGFTIFSFVFLSARICFLIRSGAKQGKIVHRDIIRSLLYTSLSDFYNRIPLGRIVNRLTKDLGDLDEGISYALKDVVSCFFSLIGALIICVYASTPLALIPTALVGYACARLRSYYMRTCRELTRVMQMSDSPVVSGAIETINGLATIRAYKLQKEFTLGQMQKMDRAKRVCLNQICVCMWFWMRIGYLSFLINLPCIAFCMFDSASNPAIMGLLMVYALSLSGEITGTTFCFSNTENKCISLERVYNFASISPQKDYRQYCQKGWTADEEGVQQGIHKGTIQLDNVSARYRKDLPDVLKKVNCQLKGGEKIGVVGRTGAGKTTLINTLLRVTHISQGTICIDSKPITEYSLKQLRHSITMIDQDPTLIKATFRENLDLTGKYTTEQLQRILDECNLLHIIQEKGGLDSLVSNDSLSAGQKQLLCICRAFLKESKVVLIDEATANIDPKNDALIQKVIAEKFRGSTVITIAHRLTTLAQSDQIMVMEQGQLVEFGPPKQLENKKNGFYAKMLKKNAQQLLS